ncbi:peptide deformylase [Stackebrandtia endophytica]|uniref:Peptide deformylase n=1 Tax=Stackebrandtia endophytica TaxID=1496996 RepID=A0A543B294_9ACTN|nr:peptide deformylase [Stackebrandtia endophytica]TQL78850.1 peptide deformylase [Stackebrandtia endophytica]
MTAPTTGTARPIVYYGDPVLHRSCQPVTEFDDRLAELIADMFASMYAVDGVGLAANQIGVDARVFVLDCADESGVNTVAHVVNPTLEPAPTPRELVTQPEGCLSVPGQFHDLARPTYATVTGFDMTGKPITLSGDGTLGQCLQHEFDHLEGMVYVDRLPRKARKKLLAAAGLEERPAS